MAARFVFYCVRPCDADLHAGVRSGGFNDVLCKPDFWAHKLGVSAIALHDQPRVEAR